MSGHPPLTSTSLGSTCSLPLALLLPLEELELELELELGLDSGPPGTIVGVKREAQFAVGQQHRTWIRMEAELDGAEAIVLEH